MSAGCDVVVVGGGIVGTATALALTEVHRRSVVVLEAEPRLAAHQSGHNSGVIHAGLYYRPGSLKARLCRDGREQMFRFCDEEAIPVRRCGKLVVATRSSELPQLDLLAERAAANGLAGVRRLAAEELREREPEVAGLGGLWVPQTGVVDYRRVVEGYAARVRNGGGEVRAGTRMLSARLQGGELRVLTTSGELRCRALVNCAGLQSDRVARRCGARPDVRIVPFRGEYFELVPDRRHLVHGLIYPVPDPALPFLGVHLSRTIDGRVEAGPNAVLALKREGYDRHSVSVRDMAAALAFPGFWRMARRHWRSGLSELHRSMDADRFAASVGELVPAIGRRDLRPAGSGVRAQAVDSTGALVDDFRIVESERMVHVLNAPSPAATASIAIGRMLAATVIPHLGQ